MNAPTAVAAYEAGQQANFDGLRADQNPERFDAYRAQWWQQGWQNAQLDRLCIDPMCACRGGPCAECPEGDAIAQTTGSAA